MPYAMFKMVIMFSLKLVLIEVKIKIKAIT